MLNKEITKNDIIEALKFIEIDGVPANRESKKFNIYFNGKYYPPKYTLSIASKLATGKELKPSHFGGGIESNNFLVSKGFVIRQGYQKFEHKNKPRILRLALKTEYDLFNKDKSLTRAFNYLASQLGKDEMFDYLVTPGGFIHFDWPETYLDVIKDQKKSQELIPILKKEANNAVLKFWKTLSTSCKRIIQSQVKYITFGIDSNNINEKGDVIQCIQFVAVFNTNKCKVIHWTGKSYPSTFDQKSNLIEFLDLDTHFFKVNKEVICLLGCHDLKVFSPRAKKIAGPERQYKIKAFDRLIKKYKPNLIIQHPHNTDTYRIWHTEWKQIEKYYPFVKEYVSGIRHFNYAEKKRQRIKEVVDNSFLGKVKTIIY